MVTDRGSLLTRGPQRECKHPTRAVLPAVPLIQCHSLADTSAWSRSTLIQAGSILDGTRSPRRLVPYGHALENGILRGYVTTIQVALGSQDLYGSGRCLAMDSPPAGPPQPTPLSG